MHLPPSNPSDPLHPTYYARKRDAWEEHINLIKTALWYTIQNVNFADPTETRKAHEALMCDAYRETKYIGTKYSVWIDPLYLGWDKFISVAENTSQTF